MCFSRCDGKISCEMSVNSRVFGDPCPGTQKYVEVHYACAPKDRVTTKVRRNTQFSLRNLNKKLF